MAKPKIALYWAAGCGGCDVAVLDTNEKILDIAALADIVFWPIALDFKYHHVEAMKDGEIDLCLFNGAVRSSEQEHLARLLRAKSKVLMAFGACACWGGIPALANFTTKDEIMQRVYRDVPSVAQPDGIFPQTKTKVPEGVLELPELFNDVKALHQIVPVEYFMPGCPPPVDLIWKAVTLFATNALPPAGAVIASEKSLCDECRRVKEKKEITKIYRPHQIKPDPEKCLLEQGIICAGPATRGGCGERCLLANMPCRGCFGPPPGVLDQGAKLVSAIASIYQDPGDGAVERMVEEVVDPAGTFYRFGMSTSMLGRKRFPKAEGGSR